MIAEELDLAAFGERLYELREERGWSQRTTAAAAKLSHPTIVHLEAGKVQPRLPTLRKLARAFGMSVEELVGEASRPKVPEVPPTPLASSSPEELEVLLFGARVEEGVEPTPVKSEPEALDLVHTVRRERDTLEDWLEAYESAPSAERLQRRADKLRVQGMLKRAKFYYLWTFNCWSKLSDPRGVPFKGTREFASETDEANVLFLDAMSAEAERKNIEKAGEAG